MSKSAHTLKVQKGNTTYTCDLYTTTAEAAIYGSSSYLPVNIQNTNLYAPLYPTTFSQTYYDNYGTPVHVEKGGTEYVLAQKSLGRVGITASSHQTITVTPSVGSAWTSGNKYFPYGTTWTAALVADTGWTKGTLSKSSGTVTNANVDISATAATHKTYTITLTQKTGETVTIHYKNHNGTSLASSWSTTTASVTLGHGSQYYCTIAGSTYYTAGTITSAGSSSSPNTLTAAVTISFTAATHITYKITLTQKSNETVTIHYKNHNGSELASSWSTTTSTVTLGKGSQYYSTIAASTGYTAGTITSAGTSSSPNTLNAAVTISFTAATAITPKVTITKDGVSVDFKIDYTNTSGSSVSSGDRPSSVTIKYNTAITFRFDGAATYGIKVYSGSTLKADLYSGNKTWTTGKITANTTYKVTGYNRSGSGDN